MDLFEEFVKRLQSVSDLLPMMSDSDQVLAVKTLAHFSSQVLSNFGSPQVSLEEPQSSGSQPGIAPRVRCLSDKGVSYGEEEKCGPPVQSSLFNQATGENVDAVYTVAEDAGFGSVAENTVVCEMETVDPESSQVTILFDIDPVTSLNTSRVQGAENKVLLNDPAMLSEVISQDRSSQDPASGPSTVVGIEEHEGEETVFEVPNLFSTKLGTTMPSSLKTPTPSSVTTSKTVRFVCDSPTKGRADPPNVVLLTIPNEMSGRSKKTQTDSSTKKPTGKPRRRVPKHLQKYIPEDLCKCNICGKILNNPSNLTVHLRTHSGLRPFICQFCSQQFTTRANLLRHEVRHTGQKQYECLTCKKKFTEKKVMVTHMRTHTGEKPHVPSHKEELGGQKHSSPSRKEELGGQKESSHHLTHIAENKENDWISQLLPEAAAGLHQCPICSEDKMKPTRYKRLVQHLYASHIKHAVRVRGTLVVKCHLPCSSESSRHYGHYHCVCGCTLSRKQHMISHLKNSKCHKSDNLALDPSDDDSDTGLTDVVQTEQAVDSIMEEAELNLQVCNFLTITDDGSEKNLANTKEMVPDLGTLDNSEDSQLPVSEDRGGTASVVEKSDTQHITHIPENEESKWILQLLPDKDGLQQCPLCTKEKFKPTNHKKLVQHLYVSHIKHAVNVQGTSVVKCHLQCSTESSQCYGHYHCVCGRILSRKQHMISHVINVKSHQLAEDNLARSQQKLIGNKVMDILENERDLASTECPDNTLDNSQHSQVQVSENHEEKISDVEMDQLQHSTHIPDNNEKEWITRLLPNKLGSQPCPICSKEKFKPTSQKKLVQHLKLSHIKHAVEVQGTLIVKCHLVCSTAPSQRHGHYHCVCGCILTRKQHMIYHLNNSKMHKPDNRSKRAKRTPELQNVPEDSDDASDMKRYPKATDISDHANMAKLPRSQESEEKAAKAPSKPEYDPKAVGPCSHCGTVMLKRNIDRHIRDVHMTKRTVFRALPSPNIGPKALAACSICGHILLRRNMDRHAKDVHKTNESVCDMSEEIFGVSIDTDTEMLEHLTI